MTTEHDVGQVVAVVSNRSLEAFFRFIKLFQVHEANAFVVRNLLQTSQRNKLGCWGFMCQLGSFTSVASLTQSLALIFSASLYTSIAALWRARRKLIKNNMASTKSSRL